LMLSQHDHFASIRIFEGDVIEPLHDQAVLIVLFVYAYDYSLV
jgi:hypothetical protein